MRSDPVSPLRILHALELFGPQARPYTFDDCFDCWGLVRKVFDWLDDGYEVNEQIGEAGDAREGGWRAFSGPHELLPGDLLASHPHADADFHTVFYCGTVGGVDLVYDASPRGRVPSFERRDGRWRLSAERDLFTRYMRAPETTDRLRHDGGAYLRLWDERQRYVNVALHGRLAAGGAAGGRDLVALRRAAGLSELPFYCRRRLPQDARGRELYDNLLTRHLDYYVPDGAPLPDDACEAALFEAGDDDGACRVASSGLPASSRGITAAGLGEMAHPLPPAITRRPPWVVETEPVTVSWDYRHPPVVGCRIEVWEETFDLWKHRLLRRDEDAPVTSFTVPQDLLRPGRRYALVVFARGAHGYSGDALAPFLYRPGPDHPLLAYNPVRPTDLAPDAEMGVRPGADVELSWRIAEPARNQRRVRVVVCEDAVLADDEAPVFEEGLAGPAAAACRCRVPAACLRPGHRYAWYVTPVNAAGHHAYAAAEGVFVVTGEA